jgi:hypothetical protein
MTSETGSGLPTTALSAADLMAVLCFAVLHHDVKNPGNIRRRAFDNALASTSKKVEAADANAEESEHPAEQVFESKHHDAEERGCEKKGSN